MFLFRPPLKIVNTTFNKSLMCSCSVENATKTIKKVLGISNVKAQYVILNQPSICKLDESHIQQVTTTLNDLGVDKLEIVNVPVLLTYQPITLQYRYQVLKECGVSDITAEKVAKYLTLVKKYTIAQLKDSDHISHDTIVAKRLADLFTQWPTSRSPSLLKIDEHECSLYEARVKILKRYLELVIDLPEEEFVQKFKVYVQLKHKPFEQINQILIMLQKHVLMPSDKIRSNFFLIHANPDNLRRILYEVREIGGVNIKEAIKMRPKLISTNVDNIIAIKDLFKRKGISESAQIRCLEIFTLCVKTIEERLEILQTIPEFQVLQHHPRFLKLVFYQKTAVKRLDKLRATNKKCFSLHVLSGSTAHYKAYEKAPGERNKGKDLIIGIGNCLNKNEMKVRDKLQRHDYWKNTPLVQAMGVFEHLSFHFSSEEIYENCWILLYPWKKIQPVLDYFINKPEYSAISKICRSEIPDNLATSTLTKNQILSLTLYLLEKEHYFTGNGMWNEETPNMKKITCEDDVQLKADFIR